MWRILVPSKTHVQRRDLCTVQLKTVHILLSNLDLEYLAFESVQRGTPYCRLGQVIPYSNGIWEVRVLVDICPGMWD